MKIKNKTLLKKGGSFSTFQLFYFLPFTSYYKDLKSYISFTTIIQRITCFSNKLSTA
jgi:hypothetical protein